MGAIEKIKEIEAEMARTQKNKATEYHLGLLKAKLAKLRSQLMAGPKTSSQPGEGFDVMKSGDARCALIGFPSVGKSTLLGKVTKTESSAASYEFTTLTCIPGNIEYRGSRIQLLDLPGIIEGASGGKGRGRQVIAVGRTADLIIMMMDAGKGREQKTKLTYELESVGMRLNQEPPQIYFKQKKAGGIHVTSMNPLTHLNERQVYNILHEYRIHNAEILFKEDATVDQLIDVIEGNRKYVPCLYVYNKIDNITIEEVDQIAREDHTVVISSAWELNLDFLIDKMWQYLDLVRVFTKRRGEQPDFTEPIVMRKGANIHDVCHRIHRTLADEMKYALVWGTSAKHVPQKCGKDHHVEDEDVVQVTK
eukprot:TRINITY_DN4701_c0_g1_i1.p1 TRINITY_DN4701_c0_g1~~TRINITY_DN4701_c0_g1_i1.p1  ORF type:complete len:364 (+),score=72.76 TRINITY_DN4701_c0_g1_i1:108-1199(+)